jgi:hypothetical protein
MPEIMKNLLNPKWIFIINTLPTVALFFLFTAEFNIIKSLLDEESTGLWKSFGLALGILSALTFIYALFATLKKKNISAWYGCLALFSYIPFLYLYSWHSNRIFPFSIPLWMLPGDVFLYVGTFLMPTLIHALFVCVVHFTSAAEHKAWKSFLVAVIIPLCWYLFLQVIMPLWKTVGSDYETHALLVFIITGTVIFLFFLVRGIFIMVSKRGEDWKEYELTWKIPVSVILPLIGLALNNGQFSSGIFGDFSNPWFYILAILNGVFICLPNPENKLYRLFLFTGRSITFAYTLYFFLVFLPYLPLSVVAIVAIGTGFLMLTPLALFIIHVNELSKDFTFLKTFFAKRLIRGIWLLGFLVIPAVITAGYMRDKRVLNETLNYIDHPDYSRQYNIDKASLKKTLEVITYHKKGRRDWIFVDGIPYLTYYYNWLVLDNLTLSDAKINTIEKIFFHDASFGLWQENFQSDVVHITKVTTKSTYDKIQNTWTSRVDLELTNKTELGLAEFVTTIDLPEGCWISDYYLYVGDKKENGMLAEKKSAVWLYSRIRNVRRDPGILYYLTGNKVAFRVFPFAEKETRKTGIEFLHKEPVKLTIDGNNLEFGNATETINEKIETDDFIYVSAKEKQSLKTVFRKPYFHFLVDASKGKEKYTASFTNRIERICDLHKPLAEGAQISFVNGYVNSFPLNNEWKQNYKSQNFDGGFYLDRAIKTALVKSYKDKANSYPVIVVVTDSIDKAILDKDFSDFRFAFPESDLFYNLDSTQILRTHSLVSNPVKQIPGVSVDTFNQYVLEYKLPNHATTYLRDNEQADIILKKDIFKTSDAGIKEKNWQSALAMQALWRWQVLHPELSEKEWLNLVRHSFISKVMTPVTSYLVVENEAQKAILKKKQEQVLSSNKSLDVGEDTRRMSEPGFILLATLLILALWYREHRKQYRMN